MLPPSSLVRGSGCNSVHQHPDPETFASYAATIAIRADAIWKQYMNRTELGDRACMLRHFNFSTGGGIKLKWPAKIATLLSAIAITMAFGFGARGADFSKELNPKADLQKYTFDHPAKLRWFFDENPRSLKIELGSKHYITKIKPTDHIAFATDIIGGLRPSSIKARVITGPLCQLKEGDVAEMIFDLPSDFIGVREDLPHLYDISSLSNIEIGREYYVIASCADFPRFPLRSAYIVE
jgi:hypothetical protein